MKLTFFQAVRYARSKVKMQMVPYQESYAGISIDLAERSRNLETAAMGGRWRSQKSARRCGQAGRLNDSYWDQLRCQDEHATICERTMQVVRLQIAEHLFRCSCDPRREAVLCRSFCSSELCSQRTQVWLCRQSLHGQDRGDDMPSFLVRWAPPEKCTLAQDACGDEGSAMHPLNAFLRGTHGCPTVKSTR